MKLSRGARRDNLFNRFFRCPSALALICMKLFNICANKLSLSLSLSLRVTPRLGLALGPAPARAGPVYYGWIDYCSRSLNRSRILKFEE